MQLLNVQASWLLGEFFQFGTRVSGDLRQNLVEAGIERFDFEAAAAPAHPGLVGGWLAGQIGANEAGGRFGVVTSTTSPGGFFGPEPDNRTIWYGA